MSTARGGLTLAAIDGIASLNVAVRINNSATTAGTLTLNGSTLNNVANTILSNESPSILTFQTAGGALNLGLGNATNNVIQTTGAGNIVIGSAITGSGKNLTFQSTGTGTLTLSGTNTFSGSFTAGSGTTNLGVSTNANGALGSVTGVAVASGALVQSSTTGFTNLINDAAAVTLNGTLDLTGGTETFGALAGTSTGASLKIGQYSTAAGTDPSVGTVTVGDSTSTSFAGVISGVPVTAGTTIFTKQGTGTLTLTNANTYSGGTAVTAGTLKLANPGGQALTQTTSVAINTGTLLLGAGNQVNTAATVTLAGGATINTGHFSQSLGALTLTSSSTLDFGSGGTPNSVLAFGDSHVNTWSGILSIYNYKGNGAGGETEQLFFGTNTSGLMPSQLNEIYFYSDAGTTLLGTGAFVGTTGEVSFTPVPEPTTLLGGLLLVGVAGWSRRRRRGQVA